MGVCIYIYIDSYWLVGLMSFNPPYKMDNHGEFIPKYLEDGLPLSKGHYLGGSSHGLLEGFLIRDEKTAQVSRGLCSNHVTWRMGSQVS